MSDMSKHAPKTRSTADVWFVLIITGGTSAILQMWHSTHAGGTVFLIAALVGLVPPAAAIGLSHVVAGHKSATLLRVITFAVMLAVMGASASAVASVVRPIDGPYFSWVFGLALDAAALACVWVLLGDHDRKEREATALQVAEQSAREARRELVLLNADGAALRAELETARQERAAALERIAVLGARAPRRATKPKARRSAPTDDVTIEAKALQVLAADPDLTGTELATALGVSPGYGRKLKARLARVTDHETGPLPRVES